MKVAIVGSREYKNLDKVGQCLGIISIGEFEVITGGANGVDKYAEEMCHELKINCEVIRPINPSDKFSYLLRNVEIITKADKVIAFWDGKSKGTKFVIDYASKRNKDLLVIRDD